MLAHFGVGNAPSEEDQRRAERLARLEERFRKGSGATAGEARNALRLFERELSKANWTSEKFAEMKAKLRGDEEFEVGDVACKCRVCFAEARSRRVPWFCAAGTRVARPLGLVALQAADAFFFVGPVSAAFGAGLSLTLLLHLAHLDLDAAQRSKARSEHLSAPVFLQGFVDGALPEARDRVWARLLALPNSEAAAYAGKQAAAGFFDSDAEDNDIRGLFQGCFGQQRPPEESQEWGLVVRDNIDVLQAVKKRNEGAVKDFFPRVRRAVKLKAPSKESTSYAKGLAAGSKRKPDVEEKGKRAFKTRRRELCDE